MNILISYSHGDFSTVDVMKKSLERKRISVWIDRHEIGFGDVISNRLSQMLWTCDYLVLLISPNSLNSAWVAWELSVMLERERKEKTVRAIPVLIRGDSIPESVSDRLYADFRTARLQEENFSKLLAFFLEKASSDSQSLELGQDFFADAAWSDQNSPQKAQDLPPKGIILVNSPMVGTAYLAPEPGASPFTEVGQTIREGDTLLIIEAMKTMNLIPAPQSGVIDKILVSDESAVEFGDPIVWLR